MWITQRHCWCLTLFLTVVPNCAPTGNQPLTKTMSSAIQFREHLIMKDYTYPFGIGAADLDNDGDLDLTSADALPHNNLYWFENDGFGHFTRRFIQKNDPDRLERHAIGDINLDGHPDVVIVKNLHGDILWFENSGTLPDGQLWRRHFITKGKLPGAYDVDLGDLDGDGDLDVAASSWSVGNQFAWFENDGNPEDGTWVKYLIEDNLAETRTIRIADIDGDGDKDLLGTAAADGLVFWFENSGHPTTHSWIRHLISKKMRPIHGEPADMDGDGDLDVVMAHGQGQSEATQLHGVFWYENDRAITQGLWKTHTIAQPVPYAFEAVTADLDRDGDLDVVATGWGKPGLVMWFENQSKLQDKWVGHTLKKNWERANQVIVADLDGDQDTDIAAVAERGTLEFRWWQNE